MFLCQGTHFNRVIKNESGLNVMMFAFVTENFINQFAFAHRVVNMNMELPAYRTKLLFVHSAYVNSSMLINSIKNADPLKWSFERNDAVPNPDIGCTTNIKGSFLH